MSVTVHVAPDIMCELQAGEEVAKTKEITRVANELSIVLHPQHPGTSDPTLATLYTVGVEGREQGELVAARLRACDGVEAAYYKPAAEPP